MSFKLATIYENKNSTICLQVLSNIHPFKLQSVGNFFRLNIFSVK